jgi:Ala-tRNA(Pro) deacylase
MPTTRLKDYLDSEGVRYVNLFHSVAYTAQDIASVTHISGKAIAKTVMVSLDNQLAMAVVPGSMHVDLERLKSVAGAGNIDLATEAQFRSAFPDCETGAMPPFGHLYGMPVFVDENLAGETEIVFNAGTHRELVIMSYTDFERLVHPVSGRFAVRTQ